MRPKYVQEPPAALGFHLRSHRQPAGKSERGEAVSQRPQN